MDCYFLTEELIIHEKNGLSLQSVLGCRLGLGWILVRSSSGQDETKEVSLDIFYIVSMENEIYQKAT